MKYKKIKHGVFLRRPNRFIAQVLMDDGTEETVHVKNTGRCRELLVPGANIILEEGENPNRKTRYSLIAVYKGKKLINMDSQAPNAVAYEALSQGKILEIGQVDKGEREKRFLSSRFDLYFEKKEKKGFIEVKGVTLEENGIVQFPDAPTARGVKHIHELIRAKQEGYEAYILFLVQMEKVNLFQPNWRMDLAFALALQEAKKCGVGILAYDCMVSENEMIFGKKVLVCLE